MVYMVYGVYGVYGVQQSLLGFTRQLTYWLKLVIFRGGPVKKITLYIKTLLSLQFDRRTRKELSKKKKCN